MAISDAGSDPKFRRLKSKNGVVIQDLELCIQRDAEHARIVYIGGKTSLLKKEIMYSSRGETV